MSVSRVPLLQPTSFNQHPSTNDYYYLTLTHNISFNHSFILKTKNSATSKMPKTGASAATTRSHRPTSSNMRSLRHPHPKTPSSPPVPKPSPSSRAATHARASLSSSVPAQSTIQPPPSNTPTGSSPSSVNTPTTCSLSCAPTSKSQGRQSGGRGSSTTRISTTRSTSIKVSVYRGSSSSA